MEGKRLIQKKICLLGASGVGKTNLVRQFVEGIFNDKYLTTIGVKIDKKQVIVGDQSIQLMLWDIEGNDRYHAFQERHLRGAAGYIVVVDQTRANSLVEGVDIHHLARQVNHCPAIIAINKNDLLENSQWNSSELNECVAMFDSHFSTSAKTGDNVEQMFKKMAMLTLGDSA